MIPSFFNYKCIAISNKLFILVMFCHYSALEQMVPNAIKTYLYCTETVFSQAANPGCVLEDFVRWYSPRDYVEEEVVGETGSPVMKGRLSARMNIPGNMWVEAWETARVTPARRQKRLFDDTKEAEKVIFCLFGRINPLTTKSTLLLEFY